MPLCIVVDFVRRNTRAMDFPTVVRKAWQYECVHSNLERKLFLNMRNFTSHQCSLKKTVNIYSPYKMLIFLHKKYTSGSRKRGSGLITNLISINKQVWSPQLGHTILALSAVSHERQKGSWSGS